MNESLPQSTFATDAITTSVQNGVVTFLVGNQPRAVLGTIHGAHTLLYEDGQPQHLPLMSHHTSDNTLFAHYEDTTWAVTDHIAPVTPRLFRIERTWYNRSDVNVAIVPAAQVTNLQLVDFFLIPGVSYNGNMAGHGQEPKTLYDGGAPGNAKPTSSTNRWVFGGDRSSVPACTITEGEGWTVGIFTSPHHAQTSSCSIEVVDQQWIHHLYWCLQEGPRTYIDRDTYGTPICTTQMIASGASYTATFFIVVCSAKRPHYGWSTVLDLAWQQFRHPVRPTYTSNQLWQLGMQFTQEQLWVETDSFVGFSIGLTLHEGRWIQRPTLCYEIGWCGQGAALATALLYDCVHNKSELSWQRGAAALDFWAEHGRLSNGLFVTVFDDVLAQVTEPQLDTCNLGHGAYQFLQAWELAEQIGRPHPQWREMGIDLCSFFTQHATASGKFGKTWSAAGELLDDSGAAGAFVLWPLVKAYRLTGDASFLRIAERGFRAYADDDLARVACVGGALDTDCIDKETAWPLVIAGLDLYELTGDAYYLEQAERAAYYLASWQWHYSLTFPAGTPANSMGYDTFGGTSVSTQHHHFDPWGALICLAWLRLAQATQNDLWRQRACATWQQATYGVSDGTLVLNGVVRPAGGQDEALYHTRWQRKPGDVSDWLVAWPTAFRLITLMHWPDWHELDC